MIWLFGFLFYSFANADLPTRICIPRQVQDRLTIGLLTADRLEFFRRANLQATFVPSENDQERLHFINKGRCDLAVVHLLDIEGLPKSNLRDVEPLVVSLLRPEEGVFIVVPKKSRVNSIRELRGRRMFIADSLHKVAMEKALAKDGLSLRDIQFTSNFAITEVESALRNRQLDALVVGPPMAPYLARRRGLELLHFNLMRQLENPSIPHTILIVGKKYLKNRNKFVPQLQIALRETDEYLRMNPSDAIISLAKATKLLNIPDWEIRQGSADYSGTFFGQTSYYYITPEARRSPFFRENLRGGIFQPEGIRAQ